MIAGGYDKLNQENVDYYRELISLSSDYDIPKRQLIFLRSPCNFGYIFYKLNHFLADQEKLYLLKRSTAVIYTPNNEHFGIVPIEAMYLGKPVIAVNSGGMDLIMWTSQFVFSGPMETVENGKTGFLLEQTPEEFAKAMKTILEREDLR